MTPRTIERKEAIILVMVGSRFAPLTMVVLIRRAGCARAHSASKQSTAVLADKKIFAL